MEVTNMVLLLVKCIIDFNKQNIRVDLLPNERVNVMEKALKRFSSLIYLG